MPKEPSYLLTALALLHTGGEQWAAPAGNQVGGWGMDTGTML